MQAETLDSSLAGFEYLSTLRGALLPLPRKGAFLAKHSKAVLDACAKEGIFKTRGEFAGSLYFARQTTWQHAIVNRSACSRNLPKDGTS